MSRTTTADRSRVWELLADGWTYSAWVVGASRMRHVDVRWPAEEAKLHHSVGVWPLLLDDTTSVVRCHEKEELVLQARGWPFGEARIEVLLTDHQDGCRIVMREDVTHGPGSLVPKAVRTALIVPRNEETLRRLCYLAERRSE